MKNLLIVTVALLVMTACVIEPGTIQPPGESVTTVPLVRRYPLACESRSPAGYGAGFGDPRNGGECWACPNSNPVRTWAAVNEWNACATKSVLGIAAQAVSAQHLGPHGSCPQGDVQVQGNCSYCPSGSAWSSEHSACVAQ